MLYTLIIAQQLHLLEGCMRLRACKPACVSSSALCAAWYGAGAPWSTQPFVRSAYFQLSSTSLTTTSTTESTCTMHLSTLQPESR